MKVKIMKPIQGYGYAVGDEANIPDKKANELLKSKHVEKVAEKKNQAGSKSK